MSEYVRALGARDYGRNHVREVVKRLDTDRKEFSLGYSTHIFVTPRFWWRVEFANSRPRVSLGFHRKDARCALPRKR